MSEPKKIHITSGDFHGVSVSCSQYAKNIKPRYFEWHKWSYLPSEGKVITDRYIKDHVGPGKIALLLEPYELHPENYYEAASANYDAVLCNHMEWVARHNWFYYPFGGTFLAKEDWGTYPKENKVSMFISNKKTMSGHQLRWRVFRAFGGIEYFGRAFNPVDNKLDGLKDFGFQVVIESSQARGYFTEKLIDCFLTGTIPIYWGDPDITDIFDERGMVIWNGDLAELAMILNETKHDGQGILEMSAPYVVDNFITAQKYVCAEDQIWERHSRLFE